MDLRFGSAHGPGCMGYSQDSGRAILRVDIELHVGTLSWAPLESLIGSMSSWLAGNVDHSS